MKIVYVVRRFPKVSETFVTREIEEVVRQGDEVLVYALLTPRREDPVVREALRLPARVRYLPGDWTRTLRLMSASARALASRPRRGLGALLWCAAWACRERRVRHLTRFCEGAYVAATMPAGVQHIHAHFAHDATSVALVASRLTGVRFSFTGHAKDIFTTVSPRLLAAKASEASFVVAISDYTRRFMSDRLPSAQRDKVVVVHNGVVVDRRPPRRGLAAGPPVVLAVARLVEKKGIDTLIEACAALVARGIDVRCEVIGEGPSRRALERLVESKALSGRVVLRGARPSSEVAEAYNRASVFVLPCRRARSGDLDGLPVSVLEAMAARVPVITTPVSGIPEAVEDGRSGLLVRPDDPEALGAAIQRVLEEPELRERLGREGFVAVRSFSLPCCVERLRELFQEAA